MMATLSEEELDPGLVLAAHLMRVAYLAGGGGGVAVERGFTKITTLPQLTNKKTEKHTNCR